MGKPRTIADDAQDFNELRRRVRSIEQQIQTPIKTPIPLATGWLNYPAGWQPGTCWIASSGDVRLQGVIHKLSSVSALDVLFTLPDEKMWPLASEGGAVILPHASAYFNGAFSSLALFAMVDGTVSAGEAMPMGAGTDIWVSLAGLGFRP